MEPTEELTLRQVQEVTGLGRSWLIKLVNSGELPAEKRLVPGGCAHFVKRADVDALLRKRQARAEAEAQGEGGKQTRKGRRLKLPTRADTGVTPESGG